MNKFNIWIFIFIGIALIVTLFNFIGCGHPTQPPNPDTPSVVTVFPSDKEAGVNLDVTIAARFDREMDPASINDSTFIVTSEAGAVMGTVTYDASSKTATFPPSSPLTAATTYSATVLTGVRSSNGDEMTLPFSWSFTTAAINPTTLTNITTTTGNVTTTSTVTTTTSTTSTTLDPALLRQINSPNSNEVFGSAVAAGDVNGDGKADIIVGALGNTIGEHGSVYIFSGADASLLYHFIGTSAGDSFGAPVTAGDINGDGKADIIVGADSASPSGNVAAGSVYAYSGADGSPLYQKDGASAGDHFGATIAIGDVNGDGKADIIVGAPHVGGKGGETGAIYVYSGTDGSLIYQKTGNTNENFGQAIAAGDVNGDGKVDLIAGANNASPSGKAHAGSVDVYSGADGSLLYQKDGDIAYDLLGESVGAGDVNGDGKDDIIASKQNGTFQVSDLNIYSGADGSLLYQIPVNMWPRIQIITGDVNGDGKADIISNGILVFSGVNGSLIFQRDGSNAAAGDVDGDGKNEIILSYAGIVKIYKVP